MSPPRSARCPRRLHGHFRPITKENGQDIALVGRAGDRPAFNHTGQLVVTCHGLYIPTCLEKGGRRLNMMPAVYYCEGRTKAIDTLP